MLDVRAVGSDLTSAQQDEVMADLAFFLDEFGSTRAVRVKLHEQQREIKRLRRLVGHDHQILQEEDSKEGEFATRSSEKESEEVDEIMVDLSFFLGTFGSTRAVREKLEDQKQEIVALQRALQWVLGLEEAGGSSERRLGDVEQVTQQATTEREPEGENGGDTDSKNNESDSKNNESDSTNIINTGGERSDRVKIVLASPQPETARADTRWTNVADIVDQVMKASLTVRNVEIGIAMPSVLDLSTKPAEGRADIAREGRNATEVGVRGPFTWRFCRYPGCTKQIQARGLCCRHGGYHVCKADGCTRRAVTKHLCRHHGGGTKCGFDGCEKLSASGCRGYCYRHAREHGTVPVRRKCKIEGCHKRQQQDCCQEHSSEAKLNEIRANEIEGYQTPPQAEPKDDLICSHPSCSENVPSNSRSRHGGGHTTCRAIGCLQWVQRNGDPSEYCVIHRGDPASRGGNLAKESTTLLVRLDGPQTVSGVRETEASSYCKEPGCNNMIILSGAMRGYCFRHGGGVTSKQSGCPK